MIYLHKILPIFLMPVTLFILVLLYGLFKRSRKIIVLGAIVFYCLATPVLSSLIFKLVEGPYEPSNTQLYQRADAIVVLSGMLNIFEKEDGYDVQWGDPDRFFGGVDLFREKKSDTLIFTAGKSVFKKTTISEGHILKNYALKMGINDQSILITNEVLNTYDESIAVRNLLGEKNQIILVTSAFHMERAKSLFEDQNFQVQSFKVDFKTGPNLEFSAIDFLPSAHSLSLTEVALRELLGRAYYSIF